MTTQSVAKVNAETWPYRLGMNEKTLVLPNRGVDALKVPGVVQIAKPSRSPVSGARLSNTMWFSGVTSTAGGRHGKGEEVEIGAATRRITPAKTGYCLRFVFLEW